jgi:hypothetical protein
MPALRELQQQIACALLDDAAATTFAATLALDPSVLTIYRNTRLGTLTRALATAFPAVRALVGEGFFEAAARQFIRAEPPATACLDDYGERFAAFLAQFPPAAGIAYLADVARLEWAVNRALHAPDGPVLELAALAGVEPARVSDLSFEPHRSVTVLELASPADAIWRAVLDQDPAAMAALDPAAGPVWLLIERGESGVQVRRMAAGAARFTQRLCAGETLQAALEAAGDEPAAQLNIVLADHLASGRFTSWRIVKSPHSHTLGD